MSINYRFILFLSIGLGLGFLSDAQAQQVPSGESEIVMTKAQLQSFLNNIADKKRAQLEKRNEELRINQGLNHAPAPKTGINPSDERMYREFDRINQRIDLLMMNAGNRGNTYAAPQRQAPAPSVIYQQPAQAPAVMYQPQQPVQTPPARSSDSKEPPAAAAATGPSEEALLLQKKINTLKEEVRVLSRLSENRKDAGYDDEISALNLKISELNAQVGKMNQPVHDNTVIYIGMDDALKKGLENYSHDIFYANNSTSISQADKEKLDEVIALVKKHSPRVTVMVQGFASKRGNARYNSQLSFNRAEEVKQYLLSKGLSARNIITMYHGVDPGTNEANARRTEIRLLVE